MGWFKAKSRDSQRKAETSEHQHAQNQRGIDNLERELKELKAQSKMFASDQADLIVPLEDGTHRVLFPSRGGKNVIVKDHSTARILVESERAIGINARRLASSS